MVADVAIADSKPAPGRRLWKALAATVGLVLVAAAAFAYRQWSAAYAAAEAELTAEVARIRALGQPLEFRECRPPAIPDADNAAVLFAQARAQLTDPPGFRDQVEDRGRQPPPGDYPAFREALSINQPALATLRQALAKPRCQFPYDFDTDSPYNILLRDVQDAQDFSRLLQADVAQSLGTGDLQRAVAAVHEHLQLARLLEDDRFAATRWAQIFIAKRAIHSLEAVLSHTTLDPVQLDRLDQRLARLQQSAQWKEVMLNERAMALSMLRSVGSPVFSSDVLELEPMRTGSPGPASSNALDVYTLRIKNAVKNHGWASDIYRPWLMRNEAFLLRTIGNLSEIVDQPGPAGTAAFDKLSNGLQNAVDEYAVAELFLRQPQPVLDFEQIRRLGLWHRQRLIIARLALRVAEYRHVHNRLPERLADVVDDQTPRYLTDLFTGADLVYRAGENGFEIFALNERGEDDGGERGPKDEAMGARFKATNSED